MTRLSRLLVQALVDFVGHPCCKADTLDCVRLDILKVCLHGCTTHSDNHQVELDEHAHSQVAEQDIQLFNETL